MSTDATPPASPAPVLKTLTAADIFAADDVKIVPVDCPEWGGRVYVRTLDEDARDRYEDSIYGEDGKLVRQNLRSKLAVAACCDEAGNPIFADAAAVERLARKNSAPLVRIYNEALKLNQIRSAEVADEKKDSATGGAAASS